jgi:O-antigen ligase
MPTEGLPLLSSPKRAPAQPEGLPLPPTAEQAPPSPEHWSTFGWRRRAQLALPGIGPRAVGGTMGARLISGIMGFGAAIITARALGPHGRAQLAVMVSVPILFSVVAVLGLDNANARFAGQSHTAFRQVVRRSLLFSAAAGTAMAAAWWFAGLIWPPAFLGLDHRLALLSAASCPASLLMTMLGAAEVGRGRIATYNLVTISTSSTYTGGVVLLLATGHLSVAGAFVTCATSQLVGAVALLVLAARRVHPDGELLPLRRYCSYAFRAYLPNLAQYGMLRMDVPIIQVLAGTSAVALYAVALPIGEALLLLPTAVALVIFPRVTSGAVGRRAAARIGGTVFAGSVILAAAAALAAPVLIPALYGTAYGGSVAVVWWMLPGLVIFAGGRTFQAYLAATDQLRIVIVATVAGVGACVAGLLLLTSRFGAPGAAAADSAGYLMFTVVLVMGLYRPVLGRLAQAGKRQARRATQAFTSAVRTSVPPALLVALIGVAGLAGAALSVSSRAGVIAEVLILLVIIVRPSAGLYVLAVAIPVSQTTFGAPLLTSKNLAALVIVCLVGQLVTGGLARPKAGTTALATALVGYFVASAILADGGAGGQNWRYVIILGIPLLCLPLAAGRDVATRRALVLLSFTAAVLAVMEVLTAGRSLVASADLSPVASAAAAAAQTGAVNHNAEGALFVLALGVLLALFPRSRGSIAKLAICAGIVALTLGVAYSFSRAAYLGVIAMVAVFAVRRSIRSLVGTAVGLGCLLPLLPAVISARLGSIWNSSGLDIDSAIRIDLWSSALRMFDAHPLFGVGYLNFANQLPAYFIDTGNYSSFPVQLSQLDFAHNIYLTVLAETGLAGAVLVSALTVVGWRRAWSAARSGDWAGEAALLAFVGVGICSAFGEVLLVPPILAAFLLAVLAARSTTEGAHD